MMRRVMEAGRGNRKIEIARKTKETQIRIGLDLDGTGKADISTTIPFLDHMLTLMARHGFFDLSLEAKGDTDVDYHHTVEDIGIVLGSAVKKALGDKRGVRRYGAATVPMDETLAAVALDISGRPYLVYNVELSKRVRLKEFDPALIEEFFRAFINNSGITLHINIIYGRNIHHILEAVFKAFGKALRDAVEIDRRVKGVLSTKGRL